MLKFLFAGFFLALISTGVVATGDDFRTYHEKNFVKKLTLDESKLDPKTLELLNLARVRGETDPRLMKWTPNLGPRLKIEKRVFSGKLSKQNRLDLPRKNHDTEATIIHAIF